MFKCRSPNTHTHICIYIHIYIYIITKIPVLLNSTQLPPVGQFPSMKCSSKYTLAYQLANGIHRCAIFFKVIASDLFRAALLMRQLCLFVNWTPNSKDVHITSIVGQGISRPECIKLSFRSHRSDIDEQQPPTNLNHARSIINKVPCCFAN